MLIPVAGTSWLARTLGSNSAAGPSRCCAGEAGATSIPSTALKVTAAWRQPRVSRVPTNASFAGGACATKCVSFFSLLDIPLIGNPAPLLTLPPPPLFIFLTTFLLTTPLYWTSPLLETPRPPVEPPLFFLTTPHLPRPFGCVRCLSVATTCVISSRSYIKWVCIVFALEWAPEVYQRFSTVYNWLLVLFFHWSVHFLYLCVVCDHTGRIFQFMWLTFSFMCIFDLHIDPVDMHEFEF